MWCIELDTFYYFIKKSYHWSMDLVWTLIIGGAAGWLTGVISKGDGYGVIMNVILGILGGLFGGWVVGLLGFNVGGGLLPQLITAVIGAVLLVWIYKKVMK
jgi:uncharacterized membrane protein YeaQ/YmgE (transglycosylase-associated protein family)